MRVFLKTLRWIGLTVLSAGLIIVVLLAAPEIYLYLTQSEAKAQNAAHSEFLKTCASEGLDPESFHGPTRPSIESDTKFDRYNFVWARSSIETITITVRYLPYDVMTSISAAIIERKFPPSELRELR